MTKAINFIATLMILQGFTFFCVETTTTTSTIIMPSPTTSVSMDTEVVANTSTLEVVVIEVTTTTVEIVATTPTTGVAVTTPATEVAATTPATEVAASSSSVVVNKTTGPTVTLNLTVTVNCSGGNLEKLKASVQIDIKVAFKIFGFSVKACIAINISCNSPLNMVLELSFYSPIPAGKTIQGAFEDALKNGLIRNLTTSNTEATFTFVGATITYKPKAGQCQQVCCDGAGGEMTVVPECTPADKCEGILLKEKKEDGHCPGDSKGTCSVDCDDDTDDSGGLYTSPSFAVVVLLAFTSFIKTTFY